MRIEDDLVAVLDKRDRPADGGLGGDVADAEALRAAGEPPVGDKRAVAAPARRRSSPR